MEKMKFLEEVYQLIAFMYFSFVDAVVKQQDI